MTRTFKECTKSNAYESFIKNLEKECDTIISITKIEEKQKNILCLDLGTTTGWASNAKSGSINFSSKKSRFEGGGMRYLRFSKWLNKQLENNSFESIYFEEVHSHKGIAAAHAYGGFLATLTSWCEDKSIPYAGVSVGTIKKFITGKGNANKQMVIDAVKAKGYNPKDDNEADAMALLLYVQTTLNERF